MNIQYREYRNLIPLVSVGNEYQNHYYKNDVFYQIYFLDKYAIVYTIDVSKVKDFNIFGKNNHRIKKIKPKDAEVNKINSVYHNYTINSNKLSIVWEPYVNNKKIKMEFKGDILLNGDAILGTFYENDIPIFPKKVYYYISKPLPNDLIENNTFFTSKFIQNREFKNIKPITKFGKFDLKKNSDKAFIYISLLENQKVVLTYSWQYEKILYDEYGDIFNNSWPYNANRPIDNGKYCPVFVYEIKENSFFIYDNFKNKNVVFEGKLSANSHLIKGFFYYLNKRMDKEIVFYDVDKPICNI